MALSTLKPGALVTATDGARFVVLGREADVYDYSKCFDPHPRPLSWGAKLVRRGGFHVQNLDTGALDTRPRATLTHVGHFTDGAEGLLPRARVRLGKAA